MRTLAAQPSYRDHLLRFRHKEAMILGLSFGKRSFTESETLIHEYAYLLSQLKPGERARVLVDFQGATYDTRLSQFWRARLELFCDRVEKSAVIGADRMIATAIQGVYETANLLEVPFGCKRVVLFGDRVKALDWLAS